VAQAALSTFLEVLSKIPFVAQVHVACLRAKVLLECFFPTLVASMDVPFLEGFVRALLLCLSSIFRFFRQSRPLPCCVYAYFKLLFAKVYPTVTWCCCSRLTFW
jgi:hypothetical protein